MKGIGTDIVARKRIHDLWQQYGQKFAQRILSEDELKVFANHKEPEAYLAKRFAAKEAIAKAVGTGIGQSISFQDISVMNNAKGKPEVVLNHKANLFVTQLGITQFHISLSDETDYALAFVLVE